jgi:hypothetical protein
MRERIQCLKKAEVKKENALGAIGREGVEMSTKHFPERDTEYGPLDAQSTEQ